MAAVKVKKVSPYPIAATLSGSETLAGRIAKLTSVGILCETEKPLQVGQQFTVVFTLPVVGRTVQAMGVVIKTYARYGGEPGKSKSHSLNEIHFRNLGDEDHKAVHNFLTSIRQV
jgi:hypothetical protein